MRDAAPGLRAGEHPACYRGAAPGEAFQRCGFVGTCRQPRPSARGLPGTREGRPDALGDGVAGKTYHSIDWQSVTFSPDSRRVAYVVERYEKLPESTPEMSVIGRVAQVVVDGSEGPDFESIDGLRFSPDSRRVAYAACENGKYTVIVADAEACTRDGIFIPVLPSACAAPGTPRPQPAVQLDGRAYDDVSEVQFSPDSRRLGYVGARGDRQTVVVDGAEGPAFDTAGYITFSPDSRHLAYMVRRAGMQSAICDGAERASYAWPHSAATDNPVFSPDSKRFAYILPVGDKRCVVVDGVGGKPYDGIRTLPIFSPDSRHFAYEAWRADHVWIVVDGVEVDRSYDGPRHEMRLRFTGPDLLAGIAERDREFFRIEVRITEP